MGGRVENDGRALEDQNEGAVNVTLKKKTRKYGIGKGDGDEDLKK